MNRGLRGYAFIDWVTQGYIALVGLFILLLHGASVPRWPWLLAGHALAMILIHGLIRAHQRWPANKPLDFLRHFYPVLLYTAFYRETGELNRMLQPEFMDPHFIRWEERIFGFQPCLVFMEALPYVWVSEIFYAAYFSYYLMIAGVGLALFRRSREQFFHYVSVVSFVFYVCYLIYIFLPVVGPRIFHREFSHFELPEDVTPAVVPDFPMAVQSGPLHQLMGFIYRHFESEGAAFPSSHVAVALCTVFFSFLYLRRIRFVHLIVALLLCVSTVYCRYHYVVDVAAGMVTAAVLVPLGNWLYARFRERPPPDQSSFS